MRRNQQSNEIRTNILFEIAVVGETAVRDTLSAIFDATSKVESTGVVSRVVGITLKKPTSNAVYLTKNTVKIEIDDSFLHANVQSDEISGNQDEVDDNNITTPTSIYDEEVSEND